MLLQRLKPCLSERQFFRSFLTSFPCDAQQRVVRSKQVGEPLADIQAFPEVLHVTPSVRLQVGRFQNGIQELQPLLTDLAVHLPKAAQPPVPIACAYTEPIEHSFVAVAPAARGSLVVLRID